MKKILGIVAEYNPFHNGHLYHLQKSIEMVHPDLTYIVMSSCFSQRGDLTLLSPASRAEMALKAGADAVFALPVCWVLSDADRYASSAVNLLHSLGVTHLSFGSEEQDIFSLEKAAQFLIAPPPRFNEKLKFLLASGIGFPRAFSEAFDFINPNLKGLFEKPNNILAVNYIRTILKNDLPITPVPILRNSDYHSTSISRGFPSASSIRIAIHKGNWDDVFDVVPDFVREIILRESISGQITFPDSLTPFLRTVLSLKSKHELFSITGLSEGIENVIFQNARQFRSLDELIDSCSGKRYSKARINRLLSRMVLNINTQSNIPPKIPAAILLGIKKGIRLETNGFPILSRGSDYHNEQSWVQIQKTAHDIRAAITGQRSGLLYTEKVVTL